MNGRNRKYLNIGLAAILGVGFLFVNEQFSVMKPSTFTTQAQARIGRPLTPLSGAGVARRVTRRHIYGGAAVVGGAAAYGAYRGGYYRPACGYYPYPPCY